MPSSSSPLSSSLDAEPSSGATLPIEASNIRSLEKAPSVDAMIALTKPGMEQVNALILDMAGSHVEMIPQIADYLISSGGKRLRPMLTLAAADLCGYQGDGHVKLAACVEFMHTATLLHDDVVDESDMRRGKESARMVWGNQASVLVGDYLLGQSFRMMVEVGSLEALDILSTASSIIAEGEVMQLVAAQNTATTEADYMKVIESKTAALFAAAAEVGPVLANAPATQRQALQAYGMSLGLAFQLIDDALDYGGSTKTLGKNAGDDLREGKFTLPVLIAYAKGSHAERAFFERVLVQRDYQDGDLDEAIAIFQRYDALNATIARAEQFGDTARKALHPFPDSALRAALLETIDFCISRAY